MLNLLNGDEWLGFKENMALKAFPVLVGCLSNSVGNLIPSVL